MSIIAGMTVLPVRSTRVGSIRALTSPFRPIFVEPAVFDDESGILDRRRAIARDQSSAFEQDRRGACPCARTTERFESWTTQTARTKSPHNETINFFISSKSSIKISRQGLLWALPALMLKDNFGCELHDPWILSRENPCRSLHSESW